MGRRHTRSAEAAERRAAKRQRRDGPGEEPNLPEPVRQQRGNGRAANPEGDSPEQNGGHAGDRWACDAVGPRLGDGAELAAAA